jgi:hypothetical protein
MQAYVLMWGTELVDCQSSSSSSSSSRKAVTCRSEKVESPTDVGCTEYSR